MADLSEFSTLGPNGQVEPRASVLLVDDNPANLLSLRTILQDLGHDLVEVCSGEEALREVRSNEFAVVLLDVLMPGVSGFETARLLRVDERSKRTPIIFLTANDIDGPQLEEAYALGAVDLLVKPLAPPIVRAKVRGFIELFQDKQRARQEANQLRLLVHGTTEYAIFMLDPEGHVVTWNAGAERLKGYKAAEIFGQHFSRFYPQADIDRGWPAHELKVARTEGRFEDEGWRLRKDGSRFWANVVITALRDERGVLQGFSKVTRDLTERKRSEENALRLVEEAAARRAAEENARLIQEQRERLHVTLASIGDGVIVTDSEGRVEFLNPVAEELVGWKMQEAADRTLEEVFRIVNEESRQPVENPALRALKEGVIVGLANHTVLIAKQGVERPIDDSAAPIRDEDGNVVGSVLVFRDVTEEKKTQKALREQTRLAKTLNRIGQAVAAELDLEKIVQTVTDEATALTGAQFGAFFYNVIGEQGEAYTLYTLSGVPREAFERFPMPRNTAIFEPTFKGVGVVRLDDVMKDPRYGKNAPYKGMPEGHLPVRSYLAVPVVSRSGEVLGGLFFGHSDPGVFTERHERLVVGIVAQASVAIDNARLFETASRERGRAEESERHYRTLADAMPQIVWTATPDGNIDFLNRRWTEFTGEPQTAGNEGWGPILHSDDSPDAFRRWAASVESGAPFEMEIRLLDRQRQSYRWHLMRTVAVRDGTGGIARWYGTATDIHDQKLAEESSRYLAEASAALSKVTDYESTLQKVANLAVPHFADWSAVDVADERGGLRRLAVAHEDAAKVALVHELMRDYPPDPEAPTGALEVYRTGKPEFVAEITDEMLVH
jgi:PAS domain S-box-containing protein